MSVENVVKTMDAAMQQQLTQCGCHYKACLVKKVLSMPLLHEACLQDKCYIQVPRDCVHVELAVTSSGHTSCPHATGTLRAAEAGSYEVTFSRTLCETPDSGEGARAICHERPTLDGH